MTNVKTPTTNIYPVINLRKRNDVKEIEDWCTEHLNKDEYRLESYSIRYGEEDTTKLTSILMVNKEDELAFRLRFGI